LETISSYSDPSPQLEQYSTPAHIAADILFTAYVNGHIKDKIIADLGCGTGIFALGSAYIGAEKVKAIDIDEDAVAKAKREAKKRSLANSIDFKIQDVTKFRTKVDTVIMNPPFGSQKKGADLPFLEKAFKVSDAVYSIHNAKTVDFLENFIKDKGHSVFWEKRYMFEIHHMFEFHKKKKEDFEVILFGINVKRE